MSKPSGDSYNLVGFFYDLRFILTLIYCTFFLVFIVPAFALGLPPTDFTVVMLMIIALWFFLDLQVSIIIWVSRHGWKRIKRNYKLASALLIISPFTTIVGDLLLKTLAVKSPFLFLIGVALLGIPLILGLVLAISCYWNFKGEAGVWKKDEQITEVLLEYSYFYPKIFRRKKNESVVPNS